MHIYLNTIFSLTAYIYIAYIEAIHIKTSIAIANNI